MRDEDNSDKGFLKEFAPAYLPQPIPSEYLVLFCIVVATTYSRVKKPVPAKSSNPIAKLGTLFFLGL